MTGKVSRVDTLKYTPAGTAVREFTLAVPQQCLDRRSNGYFQAMIFGPVAEETASELRIGKKISVRGSLWMRTFKNRQGLRVSETKILVDSINEEIRGEPNEKK